MTLWLRSHAQSRDKLKARYVLFCKANGHQTWQTDNLWWGKLIRNDPLTRDHMKSRDKSILPQALWPLNMIGWKLMVKGIHQWSHKVTYGEVNAPMNCIFQPRPQRIFLLQEEGEKEALEHFKYVIKICPNRGHIFQNKSTFTWEPKWT